ncbi:MAG: sugar phosphate isomerases/epimerase [uncultured archaeon A07HR60]|jgi:Sugar phosphate isomerases/epimerases|nr:MAG: sugar phosphate isomerases/epimerase [uncultured archaeon A07HR60]
MDIGVSIGPYTDRIPSLPSRFDFTEIGIGEGEQPISKLDPDEITTSLDESGLGATVHLPYRQPLSTPVDRIDEATTEYLDTVLATASAIGADKAVAHPDARGSGHAPAALAGRMAELTARGQTHDVTVCYETTGYAGGPRLDRVGELATRADAAICLDVGYAYLEAGVDGVAEFVESYGDRVEHLHVHGARRRNDTHIPVGSGDVEYDALAESLVDADPESATVEVFTDDSQYLTSSADRFLASIDSE